LGFGGGGWAPTPHPPIPNPQSPIPIELILLNKYTQIFDIIVKNLNNKLKNEFKISIS